MSTITICDVGPRDGLQTEDRILQPQTRAELASKLFDAGVPRVELASFVSPSRVPQMADPESVVMALAPGLLPQASALVLSNRGAERALLAGIKNVNYAIPATDSLCLRNQGTTVDEALALLPGLTQRCAQAGARLTVYISAAFGCPYDGAVEPGRVLHVAERALRVTDRIVLADTIGVAVPTQVEHLVRALQATGATVGCHFHDTRNTGIANAVAAVGLGVTELDSSVGGAGGCPFAPGSEGNIATEDLVYVLTGMGLETGIDLDRLIEASRWLGVQLGHPLPGRVARAGTFAPAAVT